MKGFLGIMFGLLVGFIVGLHFIEGDRPSLEGMMLCIFWIFMSAATGWLCFSVDWIYLWERFRKKQV